MKLAGSEETFKEIVEKSKETLMEYLESDGESKALIQKAKIASTVLSAYTRHEQTASARDATNFMMARELAEDKVQLEKYIRATMPTSRILKALARPALNPGEPDEEKIN